MSPSYGIIARFESMKRIAFVLFLVTSIGAIAQQPGQSGPLTNQRIIELVHSGVRVDELARMIATAPEVNFDLTPTGENAMMQAGVSEETIKAMAAREGSIMDNNAPVQQPTMQPQPSSSRWTHSSEWSPRFSLFGGYSYLNVDTKGLASRQSANGWEASVAFDAIKWMSAEGDFSGHYKNENVLGFNVGMHDFAFLGGPRINVRQVFFHALVGGDTLTGSALGLSASQTGFAAAFGGGVQSKTFGRHWAVRSSADYLLTRIGAVTENNLRVGGGIVYIFAPISRR